MDYETWLEKNDYPDSSKSFMAYQSYSKEQNMANCLITGCVLHNRDTKESWRGDLHEVANAYVVNVNEQSRTVGDVNDADKVVWFDSTCNMFERRGVYVLPSHEFDVTFGLNDAARDYLR